MAIIPFHNLANVGIVKDATTHELPPEAWTDGRNVRFRDGKVERMLGSSEVLATPTVAPYWLLGVALPTEFVWLYPGLAKAYAYIGGSHTNITRASGDYTGDATNRWNGGVLGGIPVINNGVDYPQCWLPVSGSQLLIDLSNWPASTYCKVIRPFKNFLVALYISDAGGTHPHMVKWSHPAVPGAVPTSWDENDATVDAGENELPDTGSGLLVDCAPLRDINVVYKEASTWGMVHTQDQYIWRFFEIFQSAGALTQDCAKPISLKTGVQHHIVMSQDDLFVHNGAEAESVIDKKMRRWLSNNIDTDNYVNSFIVVDELNKEALFCFPETDMTTPTMALVWNYFDNTPSLRDLNDCRFIASGIIGGSNADVWDSDTGVWDDDTGVWDERQFSQFRKQLLQADSANTKLFQLGITNQTDGTDYYAFVEREGLAIVGKDRFGEPKVDYDSRKLATEIWVTAEGNPFYVQLGAAERVGGSVSWATAQLFTPGTTLKLDFTVNGRLIAVRFYSQSDGNWKIHNYSLNLSVVGTY